MKVDESNEKPRITKKKEIEEERQETENKKKRSENHNVRVELLNYKKKESVKEN